jgi:hypothetical protein
MTEFAHVESRFFRSQQQGKAIFTCLQPVSYKSLFVEVPLEGEDALHRRDNVPRQVPQLFLWKRAPISRQKKGKQIRNQGLVAHAESHSLAIFVATSGIWMIVGNAIVTTDHRARNTALRGAGLCSSSWRDSKVSAASLL